VPETAREKAERGEVVAVGSGALDERGRLVSIDVRVGDVVLFGKSSGTEMRLNDEELVIMKEGDVLGILAEAPSHKKAA
jgi:chaperonin GroES